MLCVSYLPHSSKNYKYYPIIHTYDHGGRLIQSSQSGRVWAYGYNAQGRLLTMTNPLLQESYLNYDDNGRLISQTSAEGKITLFDYDDNNNLTGLTHQKVPNTEDRKSVV